MSARVRSIEAVREFRAAVQVFLEEATGSLQAMQLELQRGFEWIEHDRPKYWEVQTRRAFDLVAQTRAALSTCQMRTVAGRRPSCIEEKQAYAAAKRRLEHCQQQIERVRHWNMKLHHDANEFRGRMSALGRAIERDVPQLLALLLRTAEILERYAEIAPADDAAASPPSPAEPPRLEDAADGQGKAGEPRPS